MTASVSLLCLDAMALRAAVSVGLTMRLKKRKAPTTFCRNLICSAKTGGVSSEWVVVVVWICTQWVRLGMESAVVSLVCYA